MEESMNLRKLENEVKSNSEKAHKIIDGLLADNKDKYLVYYKGIQTITNTLKEGKETGITKHGSEAGFSICKITKQIPTFSALVKL